MLFTILGMKNGCDLTSGCIHFIIQNPDEFPERCIGFWLLQRITFEHVLVLKYIDVNKMNE